MTAHLLREMLGGTEVETLVAWTREPALLPRVTFGENRGRRWSAMSDEFVAGVLQRRGFDADIRFTARREQAARAGRDTGTQALLL